MTEQELRDTEKAQEEYRTAWIEAEYIVAGWRKDDGTGIGREDSRGRGKIICLS